MPNVAVLIDAENVMPVFAEQIMSGAAAAGTVVVREIYGTAAALTTWTEPVLRYALHPNLTIKASKGKNTSDIALTIGAMDLMMMEKLDLVVLVSSDSDFSGLSVRLRSQGIEVTGMGTEKANPLWRTACTNFVVLQPPPTQAQLRAQALKAAKAAKANGQPAAQAQSANGNQSAKANGQPAAQAQNGNGNQAAKASGQPAQAQSTNGNQTSKANGQPAQTQNGNGNQVVKASGQPAAQAQNGEQPAPANAGQAEQKNGASVRDQAAQDAAAQGTPAGTEQQSGATHAGRVAIIRDYIAKQLAESTGRMSMSVLFQGLNALPEYLVDQRRSSRKPSAYLKWLFGDVYQFEEDATGGSWISLRSHAAGQETTESVNAQDSEKAQETGKTEHAETAPQAAGEAEPAAAEKTPEKRKEAAKPQRGASAWAQQTAARQQALKTQQTKPEAQPADAHQQEKQTEQPAEQPVQATKDVQDAKHDRQPAVEAQPMQDAPQEEQPAAQTRAKQPKKRGRKPGQKSEQKPEKKNTEVREVSLHEIGLPNRSLSSLLAAGYTTLNEVAKLSDEQLMGIKNVGTITVDQIRKAAKEACDGGEL